MYYNNCAIRWLESLLPRYTYVHMCVAVYTILHFYNLSNPSSETNITAPCLTTSENSKTFLTKNHVLSLFDTSNVVTCTVLK